MSAGSDSSPHSGDEERRALENELDSRVQEEGSGVRLTGGGEPQDNPPALNGGFVLYVSGLARSMGDEDLRDLFAPFGTLLRAQAVSDPHTSTNRGFGFVSYGEEAAASRAIEALHGKDHLGRVLAVERAKRVRPRSPTPGKYYGPRQERDRRGGRPGAGRRRSRSRSRSRSKSRGRYGGGDSYRGDRYRGDRGDRDRYGRDRYERDSRSDRDRYDRYLPSDRHGDRYADSHGDRPGYGDRYAPPSAATAPGQPYYQDRSSSYAPSSTYLAPGSYYPPPAAPRYGSSSIQPPSHSAPPSGGSDYRYPPPAPYR